MATAATSGIDKEAMNQQAIYVFKVAQEQIESSLGLSGKHSGRKEAL